MRAVPTRTPRKKKDAWARRDRSAVEVDGTTCARLCPRYGAVARMKRSEIRERPFPSRNARTAWPSRAAPNEIDRTQRALGLPCGASASPPHQAGGDFAVDVDERAELLGLRLPQHGDRV